MSTVSVEAQLVTVTRPTLSFAIAKLVIGAKLSITALNKSKLAIGKLDQFMARQLLEYGLGEM